MPMNFGKTIKPFSVPPPLPPFWSSGFCGFKIYSHYQQIDEQTEAFAEIAEVVENAEPEEEPPKR